MAQKNVRLRVSMPTQTVLDTEVDFVLLRTLEGDMGILHGHEPSAVLLDYGLLKAFVDKKLTDALMLLGGFATVQENRVTVLTTLAGPPHKMKEIMAAREAERAQSKLLEQKSDVEMQRAETALRRALVQMDVSAYSIIKGNEETPE